MKSLQVKITNPVYLHAHMIKQVTMEAGKYTSDIYIIAGGEKGNAKSLVSLMSVLGRAKLPCKIEIRAEGWDDDGKAVEAIANIFKH